MKFVRTPDECFDDLPGYPFLPRYLDVDDGEGGKLRMHYVDEGSGGTVLMLHGEPSWSFLYRKQETPRFSDRHDRGPNLHLLTFGRRDSRLRRAVLKDAGHILQEEKGEELARVVVDFVRKTSG